MPAGYWGFRTIYFRLPPWLPIVPSSGAKAVTQAARRFAWRAHMAMARGRKLAAQADQLKAASEAGDPQAMWDYALLLLRLRAPQDSAQWGLLPFLSRVSAAAQGSQGAQARQLIIAAAQGGQAQAMVLAAEWARSSEPERTRQLLEQAAGQGDDSAIMVLADLERAADAERAIGLFTGLAERGHVPAMYELAKTLAPSDGQASQDWLRRAAEAGLRQAQSDVAVQDCQTAGTRPDRNRPPAADPRKTGVFTPATPASRLDRLVAHCRTCQKDTVQDEYRVIVGLWLGMRGPSTRGKTGTRALFQVCTVCGCLFPADDAARRFTQAKGGEFLNPAKRK
jgi:hypothetical protein